MGKPRILVVDDDAWILRMVTVVLEKRGYAVDTAADGQEAFEKAIADSPNLLITDVMMPRMDGWTLVKSLRGRPETAFVPVIFLTALSSDDDRIRGFRLGADDFLPKPFRFEELDLRVARTMERTKQLEALTREQIGSRAGTEADLTGNLGEVGISSLLVLMEMERKTGTLIIANEESSKGEGTLYIAEGKVVAVALSGKEPLTNEDAIYRMLEWTNGSFEFEAGAITRDHEMNSSTTALLMEGARRIDEKSKDH